MVKLHPQFIKDTAGKKLVVIPQKEFKAIIEELEELDDIRLYDEVKKNDTGERISFAEYLKNRKKKNG